MNYLNITKKAVSELGRLGVGKDNFLRVKVIPGGCSGMTYSISIENTMGEGDEIITSIENIQVIADLGSVLFIDGLQIDFSDDLIQAGFSFSNPNASSSCGCGSSFKI